MTDLWQEQQALVTRKASGETLPDDDEKRLDELLDLFKKQAEAVAAKNNYTLSKGPENSSE